MLMDHRYGWAADPENVERLERAGGKIADLEGRVGALAGRFDGVLDRYYAIVGLVNEKTVLVGDYLREKEEEKVEGEGGD